MTRGFDENGVLDPGFLLPGRAGGDLARRVGKCHPYTKQHVLRLWAKYGLTVYVTPLGRLVHRDDVVEAARRIGWWRNEPVQGYLAGSPWCEGSRERLQRYKSDESVVCPVCEWHFEPRWSASYNSRGEVVSFTAVVPTHKKREATVPSINT